MISLLPVSHATDPNNPPTTYRKESKKITMLAFTSQFALFIVYLGLLLTVIATPILRAPAPQVAQQLAQRVDERLTNAERIARGLPLNRPRRYFDRESHGLRNVDVMKIS